MEQIGVWVAPAFIGLILAFGLLKRVQVFDAFVSGAREGLRSCVSILPPLIGLMMGITMLNASGALDIFSSFLSPVAHALGLPAEVLPLALIKPISGSGSTAILSQIFTTYGPDSWIGRVASVMSASTETTFYCIAVYYGAVGVKKLRHTVPASRLADLSACIASGLAVSVFFHQGG